MKRSKSLTEGQPLSLAGLARLRQDTYQVLGMLFLYPTPPLTVTAAALARRLLHRAGGATYLGFYGAWWRCLRVVGRLTAATRPKLQRQYQELFAPSALRPPVPLGECAYVDPTCLAPGAVLADIERAYAEAGLAMAQNTVDGPDHIAVELEFLSYVASQEAAGWETARFTIALEAMSVQQSFLEAHLCRWVPALARAVAGRLPESVYHLGAEATAALVLHDVDFLPTLIKHGMSAYGCRRSTA
jgi:TorA maturation chaperone TorD